MATAAFPDEVSGDSLECSICCYTFTKPKVLPCLHTFCEHCLREWVQKTDGDTFPCPICRQPVPLPQDGVEGIKDNVFLASLVKAVTEHHEIRQGKDDLLCTNCEEGKPATSRCSECAEFLCESCESAHRLVRATKGHTLFTFEELKTGKYDKVFRARIAPPCSKHSGEILKLYCRTCDSTICNECALFEHRDSQHNYTRIEEVATEKRETILDLTPQCQARMQLFRQTEEVQKRLKEQLQLNAEGARQNVHKTVQTLITLVKEEGERLLTCVDTEEKSRKKQIDAEIEAVQISLASAKSTCEFAETLAREGGDYEVVSFSQDMTTRLNDLTKPPSNRVDFELANITVDYSVMEHKLTKHSTKTVQFTLPKPTERELRSLLQRLPQSRTDSRTGLRLEPCRTGMSGNVYVEIAKAEMKAREKAPSVTATIKLDRNKLKLLLLSDFAASHPEVDMKIDMEHKEVKLTGDDRAVMTAKLHVYETTQYPAEERVKVSSGVAAFLKTEKGRMHFEGCLQGNQLKVAFGVEEETVKLFALKSEDLEKAKRVMTQCVSESTIPFDADSVEVLKSKEATLLFKSLQGKHLICIHLGKKNVWIVGPPHDVATVKEDIGKYISTNTIITVSVDTSEGCTKFLQEYKKDDIAEVERQHMEQAVKITSRATGGFSITGTKDGTQEAKKKLEKLVTDVKKVSKEITKPGMYKFLTGETGRALLDVAGRENRCLIIPDVPSRGRGGPNTYYSVSYSSQVSVSRRYSAPKPAGDTSFPVSTPRELTLHLFGPDQDRIDRARKAVDSIVVKNCQEQKIQNPAITMLTAEEARMIHTYGEDRDVVVKQGSGVDCLLIQGAIYDVTEVLKRIWTVLNTKVEEQRRDWGKAHSVQKDARWSYVVTQGREQKIHPAANAIIEAAYKAKKSSVKYDDENEDCEIDFKAMRVTLKQSKRSFPVQRRDKKADVGGALPSTWDPQPQDRSTKQLKLCHIVPLKSGSQEYCIVAGKFTNSLQGMRATVVSIERVQNPTLWRHYCAQRQKVAQINPRRAVEQELWHGTKKEVTEVITHNGFNRSYSGGNVGCWEGQGSYFALKAAYSTKDYYSVPDPTTKHKKMFLCKVTTGEYTKGAADMTKAPMRSDKPNVPFDSTVNDVNNPTVFVIFHDVQAYPEYLITFKMS
ncbi:PREDICTED: uncharacterized protein LOC109470056 isoform X2 [Branchiostoma belcheri]|uniref:Poly [ADP-ribose] polymerase n=1 Tax=Branchiostoma belcheri TaxID=7741 RepID=A0A6P4YRR8_BRABE|nr:PREDICTED: uncharacterized protein LOC109470056 isoform X2 [Branchiostoma belcheri]